MIYRRKKSNWNWKFPSYCKGNAKDWKALSDKCKQRDGFRCKECGASGKQIGGTAELHACHIVSKSKGGQDILFNLTTKCSNCHAKEHSHMRKKKLIF